MDKLTQADLLLKAWVRLSSILKNTRITKGLMYNEATVMLLVYNRYLADGEGVVSIKEITQKTQMLKSLVNRTINALEKKGLIERCEGEGDRRMGYVRCIREKLDVFLMVHNSSLKLAQDIIDIIGPEDTRAFIRIVQKLDAAGYHL